MAGGLFALLDDVAALARIAAASVDDVGAAAGRPRHRVDDEALRGRPCRSGETSVNSPSRPVVGAAGQTQKALRQAVTGVARSEVRRP